MASSDPASDIAVSNGSPAGAPGQRAVFSWCLYDFANSGHPTVIATFVFAAYIAQGVAETPAAGQAAWGFAMGAAGLAVALLSPIIGAIADHTGQRKPWLGALTVICALSTALLWFTRPDPDWLTYGLTVAALSAAAFEISMVFYNAMLPDVATPARMGRISGWAWGFGYLGGLLCLVIALFGLVQAETPPFGLDKASAEHVRATVLLVTLWYLLFGWPLFAFVPEKKRAGVPLARAARDSIPTLITTLRRLGGHGSIGWFLLARLFYIDGLNTLFAFGGIYAAGVFDLTLAQVIQFGIAMNVTAGLGAFAFGWVDDRLGSRTAIVMGLVGMLGFGLAVLLVDDVAWFIGLALVMGLFFGPVQAASRTWMAHMAPPELRTELFGLFALSGKITAFLGPLTVGLLTTATGSQRGGMAAILVFILIGLVLLVAKVPGKAAAIRAAE